MKFQRIRPEGDNMTNDERKENITKLINHNGGWFVVGFRLPKTIGEIVFRAGLGNAVVIGDSNLEEALEDCKFLELPMNHFANHYYRMGMD